jgi:hypothetical protein
VVDVGTLGIVTPAGRGIRSTTGVASSTTTTTVAKQTVDTRFVPVDPKTGGTLVGCPST